MRAMPAVMASGFLAARPTICTRGVYDHLTTVRLRFLKFCSLEVRVTTGLCIREWDCYSLSRRMRRQFSISPYQPSV